MKTNDFKANLKAAVRVVTVLLSGAIAIFGQQQVNLTAGPSSLTLPDGTTVPMWGYSCGAAVTGSTAACANLNPAATGWSPVVITVPTGQDLTINFTNNLSFTAGAGTNGVPTSLLIVGQLGGGLGDVSQRTTTPSPDHSQAQSVTWPIPGGVGPTPPAQGPRVQSFSTEVASGATTALTWTAPRPGTYLLESGTHPSIQGPMGLYGMVVVTTAPSAATTGTAYPAVGANPAVTYGADLPLLFSEIDPVQNNSVQAAVGTVGFSETMVWSGQPGGCGNLSSPNYHQCYPPAVNYTPLYYMINGVAFDKTHAAASLFPASPATGVAGTVLLRMVNAGLRMHVPSVVGSQTSTPAVGGFSLIAEDGNPHPGVPRVQSEVFMAAGKTYDVMINVPAAGGTALPIYDRELSLSGNATARDAGMLAYISVNGAGLPTTGAFAGAVARADTYNSVIAGQTLVVSDPAKGVIANDTNVYGVQLLGTPVGGTVTLSANGTFSFAATASSGSFTYCANGSVTGTTCSSGLSATVSLGAAAIEGANGITCVVPVPVAPALANFTSNLGTSISIKPPGVLAFCKDAAGYPLTVAPGSVTGFSGTISVDPNGGFNASASTSGIYSFSFQPKNSQGTVGAAATVSINFPAASGLAVTVVDGKDKTTVVSDYRWIIEEDRTFYIDPAKTTNTGGTTPTTVVPVFGTNFHTSYMPVVAQGCTGPLSCESGQTVLGQPAVCDVGNGVCRPGSQQAAVLPSQVHLDPAKRYYISVLPGDAADPFNGADVGHGMGGAPVPAACTPVAPATTCTGTFQPVTVLVQPTPLQTAKISVFVFEDDFPLNGEQDAGGGIDILATNEPGLGGFNITLFDDAGGTGDSTGQMTYDMFNMPLSNSLAGQIDPSTGLDACPISKQATSNPTQAGITGTIVTCPKYESDGQTLSPLAGQAVIANMMPGRYGVVATPAADRIARGEEWLQTNTLDGQKAHDSFIKVGEPAFFQEFGPAGYHVAIGFANPKIINARLPGICAGTDLNLTGANCTNTVSGTVADEHYSRPPDERLYGSGSYDAFGFTQCYVSLGDPDGEDFAFTKCNGDGTFSLSGIPDGTWRLTVFDQWNDLLVDGLSTPVKVDHTNPASGQLGQIAINQWHADLYSSTFFDQSGDGVRQDNEPGLSMVSTNIRFRDGSFSNFNSTDLNGYASFNEEFPLFNWYVVEADTTRYKNTGTHVVYDVGGPVDGTPCGAGYPPCSQSAVVSKNMANTVEQNPVPANLRVPGAVYCNNADCTGFSIANGPASSANPTPGQISSGRIDPPWVLTEGWQGFAGQNSFLEFGKKPYAAGENGGIRGHVVYASTRPFDDPQLLLQTSWEPLVPNVTINLYQEGTASDGSTSLTLVDTTKTSSWDDWAQGFRSDGIPNMNCPGQSTSDLFFFSLFNQPNYLDLYKNGGALTPLPNNSQFKCYDGMHNFNQLQPAPYDGMYQFPSVTGMDPTTGKPSGTNCTICVTDPDSTDPYRYGGSATPVAWTPGHGAPMLPAGKYVVEVVVPPGYELVKEEDKNILIGDNYIAPVTQEFGGLSNIFILPDQAAVADSYNANNAQNPTTNLGTASLPTHEGDTGSVETYWPCVGAARVVPDYISLFPQSGEVAPFAGATRNLCDRKEVTLEDQSSALAKFYIFTSTHAAAHFTGIITDDFTSEFDPFSPVFGEKFSPPNMPVSIKDWSGTEISRVYSDQWGAFDGLTYSTWEVNPPNPTGYAPQMMVTCMNDPGPVLDTRPTIVNSLGQTVPNPTLGQIVTDPLFDPAYSQFCYEIPFMPGQTQYMDTPVVGDSAFAGAGYNNPDCAYPDATPAIKEVDGDGIGPWVSAAGRTLTITALGDQDVDNYGYAGPAFSTFPYNQKKTTRHYGFGSTAGKVTVGGVAATVNSWSDTQIVVAVPSGVPACALQQQQQYGGPAPSKPALCGELSITAANGKQSIDTVTVTIGGKAPTHVIPPATIQSAIDAAAPGDLIIVNPGVYDELLIMWKPLRLQGVGAASSVINANTHPAGKLDPWRRQVNCLFGLALDGQPLTSSRGTNPYDATGTYSCPGPGWQYYTGGPNQPQVDRLPLEGILGWDTTVNGNLAELLQEPSLMGAYEGAGITVLSKGVRIPANATDIFGHGAEAAFPAGTTLLTGAAGDCTRSRFTSNFQCNPSSIDGLGITDSSQGGGGIFVHGWGHNIQIANNRLYNNTGTLSGGISIGQGEFPNAYLNGTTLASDPGSCLSGAGLPANTQLPFCFNLNVNVHHNAVTLNSSIGDELFSATPAGAGGVSFCTGADYYKFNYNWVCGNLSAGDGGGFGHLGFTWNGDIEHNSILFNQSANPTIQTNGGGLLVMGAPPDGQTLVNGVLTECGSVTDNDCVPGLGDGAGPGLMINANLIMGNEAASGSGGGLRLQAVNGTDVARFPSTPANWHSVTVQNNIIANNVAGWDGAGVSLEDSLVVSLINNTVASNDTTASAGPLFNTLGAPLASSQTPPPTTTLNGTSSLPQPAGLVTMQNSPQLTSSFAGIGPITCPAGHYAGNGSNAAQNGTCTRFSYPLMANDVFWQNRSFYIGVGAYSTNYQQNVVTLYNALTSTPAANQPQQDATTANGGGVIVTGGTGACTPGATYWDIGARGDTGPANHSSGITLNPTYSFLTSATGYTSGHNSATDPTFASQYCNGGRIPPELGTSGYQAPPGISDATMPNPIFSLLPAATVDEGNNWVNLSWGPLSLTNPVTGTTLGDYAQAAGSPVIDYIAANGASASNYAEAPLTDFFGNLRKTTNNPVDAGAVESSGAVVPPPSGSAPTLASISPTSGTHNTSVSVTLTGANLTGATAVNVTGNGLTVSNIVAANSSTVTATFTISNGAQRTTRSVTVTTPNGTSNNVAFTVN